MFYISSICHIMSYTNQDIDNSINYSNERIQLRLINIMFLKHPHLTSHMEYTIEPADADVDYYYPASFAKYAIKVTTNIPAKMCEKLSCNSAKKDSTCTRYDNAGYFQVGDEPNAFERNCQPACYNLMTDPVYDEETGEEQVQMMRLDYNSRHGCIILPPALLWHEFPFYRSTEVYEQRLNDLPTGFNRAIDNPASYSGRNYEYNKSYCDAFYDKWSDEKTTCIISWYERVLYAVVGESIVKMVKSGIQTIQNGGSSDYPPLPVLPEPPEIEDDWLLAGWRSDIDEDFILPPIDFTFTTKKIHREKEITETLKLDQTIYQKKINFIKILHRKQNRLSSSIRRRLEENYDLVILTPTEKQKIQSIKEYNKQPRKTILTYNDIHLVRKQDKSADDPSLTETIAAIIGGLVASMTTPEFWLDVGIGFMSDTILSQIKTISKKLANSIIPKLTNIILKTSTKVLSQVFTKSLMGTISQCASKIIIKTVSKVMIQLTKIMAEIASVVGIILAIITIFDLILTIWDPLGFNSKFDDDIIKSVTQQSDEGLRMQLETAIPSMTFELLSNLLLSTDDIINISVLSFNDIYAYLDALTINSEGSRIYKGFELDFSDVNNDELNNKSIANTKIITQDDLYKYEKDHAVRMRYYKTTSKLAFGCVTIGSLLLFLEIYVFAFLLFIIAFVFIFSSYLNTVNINVGKFTEQFMKFKLSM